MEVITMSVIDGFLDDPGDHVQSVLCGEFSDINDGENTFRNIQNRKGDQVESKVLEFFQGYDCKYNFVRKSPEGQTEPNLVHHDSMMGDIICLLYLNRDHPDEAGTSIFDHNGSVANQGGSTPSKGFKKSIEFRMKYNRMVVFPSVVYHGRNIAENFGKGNDARLVQVLFLTKRK